ncbi:MAG: VOC family protein [Sphingobium sp.]
MTAADTAARPLQPSTGEIASPIKLAHIVLRTSRFQEMLRWYSTALNAGTAYADDGIAFLCYDDEHHRIAFINIPGLTEQPAGAAGVHHIAFTYESLHQLLDNHARLIEQGIEPVWCVNHGPTTSMYYADPDGNQLEFQVDNYDTVEEAGKFMFTEAFATNPIGVDFDPDDLRARLAAGEDEASVKLRPASGPRGVESIPLR